MVEMTEIQNTSNFRDLFRNILPHIFSQEQILIKKPSESSLDKIRNYKMTMQMLRNLNTFVDCWIVLLVIVTITILTQQQSCLAFTITKAPILFTSSTSTSNLLYQPIMSENKKEIKKQSSSALSGGGSEYGASSTSFYTTVEKKDQYESFENVLENHCSDPKLREVITDMLDVCAEITEALRSALVTVEGSMNDFGDAQLSVDVIADNLLWDAVKRSPVVREGASEEDPVVRNVDESGTGEFTVCWDPLDGSSIVDNNWAVGTMIGVWPKSTGLIGATGRDQVTSLVALYGPRTTVLVALDDGTYEFSYGCTPEGCQLTDGTWEPWICSRHRIQIKPQCKIFSPANLRAAQDLPPYLQLVEYYMKNRYTLRYSGGLVPDVYQQFTKEQGVFCNPTSPSSPAKLRLAFEAAPFGLLVEKSGGLTSDGVTGGSILDVQIDSVDQRTALCLGSADEVQRFNEFIMNVPAEEKI